MFSRARTVATIGGVPLRLDPSLVLVALLVVGTYFSRFADGRSTAAGLVMALVAALLFLGSVLGHELAHALEGNHRGVRVRGITLFALGGVTEMELDSQRARDEFAISAVGPWSSLVLAAALGLVAEGAGRLDLPAVAEVAGAMGWTNLALAVFNLVPGAPLDGGRVLRSLAWAVTGDRHLATTIATRAGQLVGVGVALWGVTLLDEPGGVLSTVWLVVLGGFILHGATREHAQGRVEALLDGHTAAELAPAALELDPDVPVAHAVAVAGDRRDDDLVVVRTADGLAAVTLGELRSLDPTDAEVRSLGDLVEPVEAADVPADASPRTLAGAAHEHGLVRVVHADAAGAHVLTTRRGVDQALRAVLGDEA